MKKLEELKKELIEYGKLAGVKTLLPDIPAIFLRVMKTKF